MHCKLSRCLPKNPSKGGSVSVTFGSFDGLHRGHQELINALGTQHRVVLSFYPHPAQALGKVPRIPRISTLRQDLCLLSSLGVHDFVLLQFTKRLAELSAADFIKNILLEGLGASEIVVGPDARFGAEAKGDLDFLKRLSTQLGFKLKTLSFTEVDGAKISSREIRREISAGLMQEAARSLGRCFCYQGRVVRGEGRGRKIGIPTANIGCSDQIVPGRGVYLTQAKFAGGEYLAVTNIGIRPTFNGQHETIEAHLLDYSGLEFYGARIELKFIEKIREEKKFSGIAELVAQIEQDIAYARSKKNV